MSLLSQFPDGLLMTIQCNPPLIMGPLPQYLSSEGPINTSNQRIQDLISGVAKDHCPPTGVFMFIDARDAALAHALAVEKEEAGRKRFFLPAGHFSNKEVVEIIGEEFPDLKENLPSGDALASGAYPPDGIYGFDNHRSKEILGMKFRPLRECVVDTVKSLRMN